MKNLQIKKPEEFCEDDEAGAGCKRDWEMGYIWGNRNIALS